MKVHKDPLHHETRPFVVVQYAENNQYRAAMTCLTIFSSAGNSIAMSASAKIFHLFASPASKDFK